MAKSKNGGTRSMLRGRVGADVYSVGKNAKGAKQQVVRSLAETVANPQTAAQMRNRMIMATVAQLAKALNPIIDHSFDNVPNGQPSISEFVSRARKVYAADAALESPLFYYNPYGVKGTGFAAVQVSQGKTKDFCSYNVDSNDEGTNIYGSLGALFIGSVLPTADNGVSLVDATVADIVRDIFGGSRDNYITYVGLYMQRETSGKTVPVVPSLAYFRIKVRSDIPDTMTLTEDIALDSVFEVDSNSQVYFTPFSGELIEAGKHWSLEFRIPEIVPNALPAGNAVIFSKKTVNGWQHSNSYISGWFKNLPANFSEALATYPVGTERFLNGGEL